MLQKYSNSKGLVAFFGTLLTALSLTVGDAFAAGTATYDLSPVTGGIVDQVQDALVDILPIAGGLLALFVAWKLIKRMSKA